MAADAGRNPSAGSEASAEWPAFETRARERARGRRATRRDTIATAQIATAQQYALALTHAVSRLNK